MKAKMILAALVLTCSAGAIGGSADFDGIAKTRPQPLSALVKGMTEGLGARPAAAMPAAAGSVDIEVEQESQAPFARWRVRSGPALILVERIPSGFVSCRVTGPGIDLEIGNRPGSFPNYYIRGNPGALASDPLLLQVVLRIALNGQP